MLMQAATGSGKTIMGADIIHGSRNKGTRSMMIVPRLELLNQSAKTFNEYHIPFSYCASGYQMNPYAKTFLATTGTLINRIKAGTAPEVNLVIPDETHYGGAGLDFIIQYYKKRGAYGIGLSATPARLDGKGLGCWYNDMVCGESVGWLIDNKRLSDFRLFSPSSPNLEGIKTVGGDYAKGQLAERMEADSVLVGDAVKHYRDHALGRLNVAYCTSRKHSEIVAGKFRDAGIPAATIDGTTPEDERRRIIRAFAKREILVLANCELLTFGFDLSAASGMDVTVEAMSDLRPTKSLALQMQKWGRVLRRKDYPALIFDHGGNAMAHGLPDSEREWSLADRPKKERAGDGEKSEPVRQCEGGFPNKDLTGERMRPCYHTHRPAPRCPNCGAWYEIDSRMVQQVDGELVEISRLKAAMTPVDKVRMQEAIDQMTDNALAAGIPMHKAAQWAAKKVTQQMLGKK